MVRRVITSPGSARIFGALGVGDDREKGGDIGEPDDRRSDQAGAPTNFLRALELGARVFASLGPEADLDAEIAKRHAALVEVLGPHDAVEVLGQLGMSELFIDPDTYSESEHPGSAYVIELVAAELLCRDKRAGGKAISAIDGTVLKPIRELTAEATLLESLRRQTKAGLWDGPEGAARARAAAHHLYLRNPGWWWQEHETLRGLFGDDRSASKLRDRLGFDAEDAIRISEAAPHLTRDLLWAHAEAARNDTREFSPGHPAYDWAEQLFDGRWKSDPANAARIIPVLWATLTVGEACLLSPAAVATEAGLNIAVAKAYLGRMSISFGQIGDDWFALAESVRSRPYIRVTDDSYLLTIPGADLWALRSTFEGALAGDRAYSDSRGTWLERRAAEILKPALKPDETHFSVRYEDSNRPGEIDVLMRFGASALVVEAKSATLRLGARRGGGALITHLRDNLTEAAEQGVRASRALLGQSPLRDEHGEEIVLGEQIREVQTIVVTLDDLSSVAPVLWELQGTRTMPDGVTAPWVVTLPELELAAATTRWPVQLVHFLRRRARLNEIGRFVASDELDWWMHYMLYGLYFEDEEGEARVRYTSLTDPLDAWVLFDRGIREVAAPKPTMQVPLRTATFLDLLCSERPPDWVQAGCALLDGSSDSQEELWEAIDKLRERARISGKVQRVALEFTEPELLLFCAVVAPDEARPTLLASLQAQVMERLDQFGAQRTLAIASLVSSERPYDALTVIDRPRYG